MNKIANMGKTKIWLSVIVIIALGVLILALNKKPSEEKVIETPKEQTKTTTVKKTSTASIPQENLSYSQALTKYGSNRIQINESCQLKPAISVYKVGTSVMLDNRSDASKTVLFNGTKYSIAGYGFKVVTLSTAKTFQVDCGSYQNVATITVAK